MNPSDKNHSTKSGSEEQGNTSGTHPDIDDLGLLLSDENSINKSDNNSLILHVAECLECQKRLTVLTSFNQSHHIIENTTVSEVQQMLVVDYADRGFSINRKKPLRQKIQDEPSSLKAMLHYASHSEAMRLNLEEDNATQESRRDDDSKVEKAEAGFNLLSILSRVLIKFKLPFRCSFSFNFSILYSVIVSIVSISLLLIVLSDKLKPVKINEASAKQENDSRSEIEFISNGLANSNVIYALKIDKEVQDEDTSLDKRQEAGKVSVHLNEKQVLHIAWPVSDETIRYTLSFYAVSNQTTVPNISLTTTGSFVDLDSKNFESGKPYRWVFSYQTLGERMAKKTFRAKGGFVIKSFSRKN